MKKTLILTTASLVLGGCIVSPGPTYYRPAPAVVVDQPPPDVVIEDSAPPPPIVIEEYYFIDGRYYYWHPGIQRYVILRTAPPPGHVILTHWRERDRQGRPVRVPADHVQPARPSQVNNPAPSGYSQSARPTYVAPANPAHQPPGQQQTPPPKKKKNHEQ